MRNKVTSIERFFPFALGLMVTVSLTGSLHARSELSPTYTATLVEREFRNLDDVDAKAMAGIWLVQFLSGNSFVLLKDGRIMVDGTWTLKDDLLTLTRMSGPLVCDWDDADTASYRASIRGFSISFKKMDDPCAERAAVLTRGDFRTVAR